MCFNINSLAFPNNKEMTFKHLLPFFTIQVVHVLYLIITLHFATTYVLYSLLLHNSRPTDV